MKNKKVLFTAKWISYTAVMTALVTATGFIPKLPTFAGNVYWVDGMVLIAAYLTDPLASFIAGGIGSLLYDVFASPAMMVPSLIIHGLQGFAVSFLLNCITKKFENHEWVTALVCSLAGAVIVVGGYFIYRCITLGAPVASANIPRNVLQEIIGITVAMVVCYGTALKRRLKKSNLLPYRGK